MYKYLTVVVDSFLRKEKETGALQEVLDQKSKEGWRLVSMTYSQTSYHFVLIFEQEI